MAGRNEATDLLPRNCYFHAVDRQMETESFPPKIIPTEQGRRHKLLLTAVQDAENLIAALKTTRHFDRHGNSELVLPQIADALADVVAKTKNFIDDIEASAERYRVANGSSSEAAGGRPAEPASLLAVAGGMDAADAADLAATVEQRFKLNGEQLSHVADLLAAGAGKAHEVPKPGPHLASVVVFNPDESPTAQLSAFDRAAAAHKGGRR